MLVIKAMKNGKEMVNKKWGEKQWNILYQGTKATFHILMLLNLRYLIVS